MKTLLLAAAMATQNPTVDIMVNYPHHTWVAYGCTANASMYECNASPQSFVSDLGDVYFINKRVIYCIKNDYGSLIEFDCTNVSGN